MDLTDSERRSWDQRGYVVRRGALESDLVEALDRWVGQVDTWAHRPGGPGLHHFEATEHGPVLARSEDFDPHHAGLSTFMRTGTIPKLLAALFGEAAVLFKEKINFKAPGGGGFAPHQDSTAYRFAERHISVMVPLDEATIESGCLWFADTNVTSILPNTDGRIDPDWVAAHEWTPVEVSPGDLVAFDGLAPHRSETNHSDRSRRVMYLTYNRASDGDHRDRYYADKRAELDAAGDAGRSGNVLISINDDFLGKPVAGPV